MKQTDGDDCITQLADVIGKLVYISGHGDSGEQAEAFSQTLLQLLYPHADRYAGDISFTVCLSVCPQHANCNSQVKINIETVMAKSMLRHCRQLLQ